MLTIFIVISVTQMQFDLMNISPEEAFLNSVHPVPTHIDMEELLESLDPIEEYLPITVADLNTFLWGHDTMSFSEESPLIDLSGFKHQRYVRLVLLGNNLIHVSFTFNEILTIVENGGDTMTQQQFHQLVNTVVTALNLDVSIGLNDCVVRSWGVIEGFWEVRKYFNFQNTEYADCVLVITVHPKLGKIESFNINMPQNTPPNLIPVLSKNDAVAAIKTILLDVEYYDVTLPEQLILYEEPELRILDKPWAFVGISEDEADRGISISPTISKDAQELQQARLYWDILLYPNSEVTRPVVRFFIDASDGHYAGSRGTIDYGEIDPNIPIVAFPED